MRSTQLAALTLLVWSLQGCGSSIQPPKSSVDMDGDGVQATEDCDDDDPERSPLLQEICGDAIDNDCDLEADGEESLCDTGGGGEALYLDDDGDGFNAGEDCDDQDDDVHPGASEDCDGLDSDCDGLDGAGETLVDPTLCQEETGEEGPFLYGPDRDGDGHFSAAEQLCVCVTDVEHVTGELGELVRGDGGDCNDDDPAVHPGAAESCDPSNLDQDRDCDGLSAADEQVVDAEELLGCSGGYRADGDGDGLGNDDARVRCVCEDGALPEGVSATGEDCDDGDAEVGACALWYEDADRDGYPADPAAVPDEGGVTDPVGRIFCLCPDEAPGSADAGLVAESDLPESWDCDDGDASVSPGAAEICEDGEEEDQLDDNCDGETNGDDLYRCRDHFLDVDKDGYGVEDDARCLCYPITGRRVDNYVEDYGDCDDADASINPGAPEVCNSIDDDCDDKDDIEEHVTTTYYNDDDDDGYGDPESTEEACDIAPSGTVQNDDDCNDSRSDIYPFAMESCDNLDNDCDGAIDEAPKGDDVVDPTMPIWYLDADGDRYGVSETGTPACDAPSEYVAESGDCDDGSDTTYPGNVDGCDEVDNDCDDEIDEDYEGSLTVWYPDLDDDGLGDNSAKSSDTVTSCFSIDTRPASWDDWPFSDNNDDCDDSVYLGDESSMVTYYPDLDEDGYWGCGLSSECTLVDVLEATSVADYMQTYQDACAVAIIPITACSAPKDSGGRSYVEDYRFGDCAPSNRSISPGGLEDCASPTADNDCDGNTSSEDADCSSSASDGDCPL